MEISSELDKYSKQFLVYLEVEKGHSPLTIRNYRHYLGRFFSWAEKQNASGPADITLELVRNFRIYLNRIGGEQEHNLKKITQNYHLIAIRSFLKYLAKRDVKSLAPEKIELAKTGERQINFLNSEEVNRLISAPKTDNLIGLRDRAILETLFSTGLRVSELCSLNRDQINLKSGEFSVKGKGGKVRVVFLSQPAKTAIENYLKRRNDKDKALFIRHGRKKKPLQPLPEEPKKGWRLTARTVQRILNKYGKKAGIVKKVCPHAIRHSFATDLLMAGGDIRSVQALLGHASITSTQIYTHVTNKRLRDIHRQFHSGKKLKE